MFGQGLQTLVAKRPPRGIHGTDPGQGKAVSAKFTHGLGPEKRPLQVLYRQQKI